MKIMPDLFYAVLFISVIGLLIFISYMAFVSDELNKGKEEYI